MRIKLFLLFSHGLSVGVIIGYFNRVGFEWLPFTILALTLYSSYIQIRYYNN